MKIAFLLTLYSNPKQANIFIKQVLKYEDAYVFIHIDKKALQIKEEIMKDERVKIMDESVHVEWGDYTQIESILKLMKFAKGFGDYDYYSLHSGSDLLIKPVNELVKFLSEDKKYAYLSCGKLPLKKWQYGGGLGRICLYWPKFFRKKASQHSIIRYSRSIYGKLYGAGIIKGRKLPEGIDFYGRSDWFTISGKCVDDIIEYSQNSEFNSYFINSLIGSEIYFTTIANMHTNKDEINNNNNLRYIDFNNIDKKTPGSPKLLTMDDYKKIIGSDYFFARKFGINKDNQIIEKIFEITNEGEHE